MISDNTNSISAATRRILIFNKIDLNSENKINISSDNAIKKLVSAVHEVSCVTEAGLESLEQLLSDEVSHIFSKCAEDSSDSIFGEDVCLISRERHKYHVMRCIEHLNTFLSCGLPMDIAAEELR